VHSALLRHSADAAAGRATHRPASHTARKALGGSGTTAAHSTRSHGGAAHRTAAHRCCEACSAFTLIAYGATGQQPPQHPVKVVMVHSASAWHCGGGFGAGRDGPMSARATAASVQHRVAARRFMRAA
jgi:hypothetical protein